VGLIITRAHRPLNPRAAALVAEAEGADLLVIGTRANPDWTGDVAGPVVHHCLGRATCPVVAVAFGSAAKIHRIAPERRDS
jgi:nucleotide-binding universal stress UspA family protein